MGTCFFYLEPADFPGLYGALDLVLRLGLGLGSIFDERALNDDPLDTLTVIQVLCSDNRSVRAKAARFLGVPFVITPKIVVELHRLKRIPVKKAREALEKLSKIGRYPPEIISAAFVALMENKPELSQMEVCEKPGWSPWQFLDHLNAKNLHLNVDLEDWMDSCDLKGTSERLER